LPRIGQMGKKLFAYLKFKPILALIISILIFTGIALSADGKLADFIQIHFYNPSVVNLYAKENAKDAELAQNHILYLQNKFALTLNDPAVRRSFNYYQSPENISERSRIYGLLLETVGGLQSVQFVDSNGTRIHYSTSSGDIISQNSDSTAYKNYTDNPLALPYDVVSVPFGGSAKYTMDEHGSRIIFSYPFLDSLDVYWGTAIFSVSVRALTEKLIAEGRLKASDDVSVVSSPPGILFENHDSYKTDIFNKVSVIWNSGERDRITLVSENSGVKFSLISYKARNGLFFGRLVNDALFSISDSMKLILYLSLFFTFYLALLFLFNYRPNSITVLQNRMTSLKEKLFEQLDANKSIQDRSKWILELEQRREEIHNELKHNIKTLRYSEKIIDGIIDKSWEEMLTVIKAGISIDPAASKTHAGKTGHTVNVKKAAEKNETGEIEEIEELEEAEEELEELEKIEDTEKTKEIINTGKHHYVESVKMPPMTHNGFFDHASEIEFNHEYPEEPQEGGENIDAGLNINIVSPFDTMFNSLDDKHEKNAEPKKNNRKDK